MAKKKKPATKAAPRRTPRRGKASSAGEGATDSPSSAPVEPTPPDTPAEAPAIDATAIPVEASTSAAEDPPPAAEPQTSGLQLLKPNLVPTVVLHKKFGKYRCLFNNDEQFTRKNEVGSDSETNSSVEIRVVDPCASSESDSNAALDAQSDTNSGACSSPVNSSINQNDSRDMSPMPMLNEVPLPQDIPLPSDNVQYNNEIIELDSVPLPPPKESDLDKEIRQEETTEMEVARAKPETAAEQEIPVNQDIPFGENQLDYGDEDDDVITIVQIVEDDNPDQNHDPSLYYDIKIDSPNAICVPSPNEKHTGEVKDDKKQDIEFQKHFEELNITTPLDSNVSSPMDCSDGNNGTPCGTPDLSYSKDSSDVLTRPDPSLTPSSTLSDDSNSSRATEPNQNNSNDSAESSPTGVRRSTRIKTISNMKQKTKGYGLVKTPLKKALITQTKLKLEELGSDSQEKSLDSLLNSTPNSPSFPVPSDMPVKVKSRWRRSSELEMGANSPASSPLASPSLLQRLQTISEDQTPHEDEQSQTPLSKESYDKIIEERMSQYQHLDENEYLCERMLNKETKKMICDCFLTKEELERGEMACGEDCLNRLLMIECNSRCPVGDRCTNRRFQKREIAALKVFYADKKGCGVEASVDIPTGEFLMEYVGEVLDYDQFYKRAQAYSDENNLHHYFMSLKGDTVIDATLKGNISRFINHSCDPNAETQKWTVNGELRIGFFSKRDIAAGEEITFDYQFQRFGKEAQRCYCGADNCRGWIGAEPDSDDDYEEDDEDVSTSKAESASESASQQAHKGDGRQAPRRERKRDRTYKPKAKELAQDADIDADLEALSRSGVKNQSHTLRLSRIVVRAKTRPAQTALLRLLRDAHLPCRRLFLDYRGLRLLAPWCADAPLDFRLEMLQTVDRLPIPNKTMVQESRFFTIVERWLSADVPQDNNVFLDEATGLPVELPNRTAQDAAAVLEKSKDNAAIMEKIKDLANQLLERWSSLKEVFKIPKKERIQQMKEHERQANVERRAADSSGSRERERERDRRDERERDRDRERDREREKDRERERDRERDRERERERDRYKERERDRDRDRERDRDDRDRRKRRSSPESRRSIRLSDRVLSAVPPMSKEERRRAFAEAAAKADESRRREQQQRFSYWPTHQENYPQMFPPGMMAGPPNMMLGVMPEMPPEWRGPPECQPPPGFYPPFAQPQAMCMPQTNMGVMGMGYGMGGFMFGQQMPPFQMQPTLDPNAITGQMSEAPPPPPPAAVELPSQWRSAVDDRGRVYYYHVKLRQPQWLPPTPAQAGANGDTQEDSEDSEEEVDQAKMEESSLVRMPAKGKLVEGVNGIYEVIKEDRHNGLIPEHALVSLKPRKRRPGLVHERPISPRTEEDKLAGRMEVKRYKQTKEKLRRRRERLLQKVRMTAVKTGLVIDTSIKTDMVDSDSDSDSDSVEMLPAVPEAAPVPSPVPAPAPAAAPAPEAPVAVAAAPVVDAEEAARKIKEQFRSSMARVMVHHLNPYRHSDAKAGRITCTADFKHLARKLTHFVMLKELKHCRGVEELVVTDSVRAKAKMFVKKYMAKFGPVYRRPADEAD